MIHDFVTPDPGCIVNYYSIGPSHQAAKHQISQLGNWRNGISVCAAWANRRPHGHHCASIAHVLVSTGPLDLFRLYLDISHERERAQYCGRSVGACNMRMRRFSDWD